MQRKWLKVWYVLLLLLVAEVIVYGIAVYAADYCRSRVRRQWTADATAWQEAGKVPYAEIINRYARDEGVSARLVAGVIKAESSFQPRALSPTGAAGLMQIMPGTWQEINSEIKVCAGKHSGKCTFSCYYDPEVNIRIGTAYLSRLSRRYKGDMTLVLAAYNAGPGAVDRYGGIPPYSETEGYVERVIGYWYDLGNLPLPVNRLVRYYERAQKAAILGFIGTLGLIVLVAIRLYRRCRSWRWR